MQRRRQRARMVFDRIAEWPERPGRQQVVTRTAKNAGAPCGSALGSTWDVDLVERVGSMLGEESRNKAARVLLAPTVNIMRSPTFSAWHSTRDLGRSR